jgi:predicted Kef-type K+ transport protein
LAQRLRQSPIVGYLLAGTQLAKTNHKPP